MGVTSFLLLGSFGLFVTVQAQNCDKPVGGPNMQLKDNDILDEIFLPGRRVTFACDVGYTSAGGSPSSICSAGEWTDVQLVCEAKSCGAVEEVPYGDISYPTGNQFGAKAVLTCNTGYRIVGRNTVICRNRGWEGRLGVCDVMVCFPPPSIANGTFNPQKEQYAYGEVIRYSCIKGNTLNGSKASSCSEKETFTPEGPKCVWVQCSELTIANADQTAGFQRHYGYLSSVTFRCKSEYDMTGHPSVTCGIDSRWSPDPPKCEKIKTTTTTTAATTTTTSSSSPRTITTTKKSPVDHNLGYKLTAGGFGIFGCIGAIALAVIKQKNSHDPKTKRVQGLDKEAAKEGENERL
ncbi:membrane cofactor protein-like [Brachyistius frenatus]|uniref:membrane cofactor protein-like n=1 Tax=Brachyistius frenatus TaxID=100188 RepID=UPI0037E72790